jgi:hypothetical protein
MLLIPGSAALSMPRFNSLRARLKEIDPALVLESASHFYAVDHQGDIDHERLAALLQPGTSEPPLEDC